jgi:hypothetical protein
LRINWHTQINEDDDSDEINVEYWDGDDDNEEEDNSN